MDDLTIALLALAGFRILAFLVFSELFLRRREARHAVLALAWLTYAASPVAGLLGYVSTGQTDHPVFGYLAALGTLLLACSLFLYYRAVSGRVLAPGVALAAAALGILVSFRPAVSGTIAVLAQVLFLATALTAVIAGRTMLLQSGGSSYWWLFASLCLGLAHAFGFAFLYPGARLSAKFLLTLFVNVALLIFFLHFEYSQSLLRLRESEARYRFVFNAAPVALWECEATAVQSRLAELNATGVRDIRQHFRAHPEDVRSAIRTLDVHMSNEEAARLLGASEEQDPAGDLFRLLDSESQHAAVEFLGSMFNGDLEPTAETTFESPAGTTRSVIVRARLAPREVTPPIAVISAVDISERKRAEEALRTYSEQLEELVDERTTELQHTNEQLVRSERLAMLGRLAGAVAHELRNPLGVITNAVYYLESVLSGSDPIIRDYLGIIAEEVRKSEKIASDLLRYGRSWTPAQQPTAVLGLIQMALEANPPPAGVGTRTDVAPDAAIAVVDPELMQMVLANLLSNAYQAMPDGGELTVSATAMGDRVSLSVSDTGCGISPDTMAQIFEPLTTTKARGIGLGLSISRNIVEAQGGTIEARSAGVPGQGAVIAMTLPVDGHGLQVRSITEEEKR